MQYRVLMKPGWSRLIRGNAGIRWIYFKGDGGSPSSFPSLLGLPFIGEGLCSVAGFTKTKKIYPDRQGTSGQLAPAGNKPK